MKKALQGEKALQLAGGELQGFQVGKEYIASRGRASGDVIKYIDLPPLAVVFLFHSPLLSLFLRHGNLH